MLRPGLETRETRGTPANKWGTPGHTVPDAPAVLLNRDSGQAAKKAGYA